MAKRGGAREGAGRPISEATLLAQQARERIAKRLNEELDPILDKAIEQAKEGNQQARDWLSDRAWGKAPINLGTDGEGKPLLIGIGDE